VIKTKKSFEIDRWEHETLKLGKRYINLKIAPLLNSDGDAIGAILASEDVTEKVELEQQLLKNQRLVTIGQLGASIAHELRNPLGVINNSIYFLNMELDDADEAVKKHLKIMKKKISACNKIITDILEFSHIKKPTLTIHNINTIIDNTLSQVTFPDNVDIITDLDENLPLIRFDVNQLQQVFFNLINNAVDAMPDGGILKIITQLKNNIVEIKFSDNGVGISENNLKKIFEPLFTTKAKGFGLGLTTCKTLIEGHGGTIEVESEVDRGTTFIIKLPVSNST
ncbi:MAG: nitrogen regulation protein NR(II), partial [Methanosarcinales archaeon]